MTSRVLAAAIMAIVAFPVTAQEFQMEWDFDVHRRPDGRQLQNVYPVSLPLDAWIPDAANSASPLLNKCVGDSTGPAIGDGVETLDDLICLWWTERDDPSTAGTFVITEVHSAQCVPLQRVAQFALGRVVFTGTVRPIDRERGLLVRVTAPIGAAFSPRNDGFIEGDEPPWDGVVLTAGPDCSTLTMPDCCAPRAPREHLLRVPYDTTLQTATEVLCGLEGVDWEDANGDGRPDACWDDLDRDGRRDPGEEPTGLWDGVHSMSVMRFVNTPDTNGWVARSAMISLGRVMLTGPDFPLVPGEALRVVMSKNHEPALWLPPVR